MVLVIVKLGGRMKKVEMEAAEIKTSAYPASGCWDSRQDP